MESKKKIHKWNPERFVPGSMVGLKIDGLCGEVKHGSIYSTEGHIFSGLQHIEAELKAWGHLMGELYIPGMEFNKASGIIRSGRSSKPDVRLALFDNRGIQGLGFELRYNLLKSNYPPLDVEKNISLIPHSKMFKAKDVDNIYELVLAGGYEGLVIKAPDGRWMKRKKKYKGIHRVISVYEGKVGKYIGMLGGVVIDMGNGVTTNVGGGFDDDQRSLYWEDPSLIIEHEIRVEAMEHTPNGRLRHANCKEVF